MIRIVIADDEVKVCQLICGLIDWKSLDMEIVGVAHNGIEALEMIETLQPDLMITDIRMPGYDGLELINRGKQARRDIDFIIISGYSHFEYAQTAVKFGVSDYVLKPIKKNELLDALNKIHEKHRQKAEQLSSEEQLKIRLKNDIDKLRSGFFTAVLLQKSVNKEGIDIDKVNAEYHFSFKHGLFQIFIVKVDCEYEDLYKSSIKILMDKVSQILRVLLKPQCYDMEICFQDSRAYCIVNYSDSNRKIFRKQLKTCLDEFLVQKSVFEKVEFTIGLGTVEDDICRLKNSFGLAEAAVGQRLAEGTGKIIEYVPVNYSSIGDDSLLSQLTKSMEAALETLDSEGVISPIEWLKGEVLKKQNISGQAILNLAIDACSIYLMLLRKHQLSIENTEEFFASFSLHADLYSTVEHLFTYLSKVIGDSISDVIEQKKQSDTKPIRTAKQYIQQNYMNPISLKEVSSIVGFNDTYFSTMFKKESGVNFLEYLSEVRMNKAKELLKETNLSIASICQNVGYNDLKHFTKSFKKYTGLKPNEFRKIYA